MDGADVAVAYYDQKMSLIVLKDYYLESRAQCSNANGGVCPDERFGGKNDLTLISSEYRNGIIEVVYSRPLATSE